MTGGEWQRLHPLTPLVRASRVAIALVIVALGDLSRGNGGSGRAVSVYVELGLLALVLIGSGINWLVTRWRIDRGILLIESGLIRRTSRRFPADQIQAVDIVQPATARVFGLAELRVRMGASTGTRARISYLSYPEAEAVRARLLAVAHGAAEHTPPPPEVVLYSIPTGRLVGSIMLSGVGLLFEAVVLGLIVLLALVPGAVGAVVGAGFTAFILLVTTVFRRLNGEFEMTVAEAPDGFRLRAGLLQTASETIPRGKVQGARMIQPFLWRPLGWCRVVVDVAGRQRSSRENQDVSGPLRAVLPVGSVEQGRWILERIFPAAPVPGSPPPSRVRWKSPLRYPHLSWNRDHTYAVTTSGRVRLVTDWVPLAKVQSIRRVEGPVQRRLRLATVHLDTAGRNIHAAARDRDRLETATLLAQLPAACRQARQTAGLARPIRGGSPGR